MYDERACSDVGVSEEGRVRVIHDGGMSNVGVCHT